MLSFQEIQDKLRTLTGAGIKGQVVFGGALSQLDLGTRVSNDLDLGRMRWACENVKKPQDLSVMMGTTVISAEHLQPSLTGFVRVERDAEIDVAILTLYWFKDDKATFETLAQQSQNLIYSVEQVGSGVILSVERFLRVEMEEAKRKVAGQSAYRKSLALKDLVAEANRDRNGRSDAELAESLLMQRKELQEWNRDSCRRYLQVAERMCQGKEIQQLMRRWEFQLRRDSLVDGISILRAACAAAPTTEDLLLLLRTLYYEQVCKMRQVFKNKTKSGFDAVHVMRGLMLRNAFYTYCRQATPSLAKHGTPGGAATLMGVIMCVSALVAQALAHVPGLEAPFANAWP